MNRWTVCILALLVNVALAQEGSSVGNEPLNFEPEPGVPTEVAPGIRIIIDPISDSPLVVADEIYYSPHFLEPSIPFDQDFTTFTLELASRVTTKIEFEVSNPDLLVPRSSETVIPAGGRLSAGFAAFAAHAGIIRLLNENGVVLAEVPYNISKQSRFEQTVSGYASTAWGTDFVDSALAPAVFGIGYGIKERVTGISAAISFEYSGSGNLTGAATVSGSHSW